MESAANRITLVGNLLELPCFSHENHGKQFFRFYLEVPRLSGAVDILPIIAEDRILNEIDLSGGSCLEVVGQIRSHNARTDGRRHLMVFVFASSVRAVEDTPRNDVELEALVCREPIYRRTPMGREICDVMLAAPRAFHRADYLPCILWGRIALEASRCRIGDRLRIQGRLQSRIYTKLTEEGAFERTTYEISALSAQIPDVP